MLVDDRLKGTCFVAEDGLVVTNAHVVLDWGARVRVILGERTVACRLVHADVGMDVAVLEPDSPLGEGLKLASTLPAPGEAVWVMGYDAGTMGGLAPGVVAGPPVYQTTDDPPLHGAYRLCIRTKAQLGPGSSGSPVLDAEGRVVGLHWGVKSGAGLGMSVPSESIASALAYARAGLAAGDPLPLPALPYPYLGAMVRETWESRPSERAGQVVEALRRAYGDVPGGVLVSTVLSNSPAERAGLLTWDLVQEVEGLPTPSAHHYAAAVTGFGVNDPVEVSLLRVVDGEVTTVRRTLSVGDANRDVLGRLGSLRAEVRRPQGGEFSPSTLTDGGGEALLRVSIGNAAAADVSGFRLSLALPEGVIVVPGTAELVVPLLGARRTLGELALVSPEGAPLGPIAGAAGYDPSAAPGEREHVTVRLRLTAGPVPGEAYVSRAFDCVLTYQGVECARGMVVVVRRGAAGSAQ